MSHLGDRVSALVDGELSHDARDRLLAHLARCPSCHAEVEEARAAKSRLTSLGCPPPSPLLMARLREMGETGGPLPPVRRRMPRGPGGPLHTATLGPSRLAGGSAPAAEGVRAGGSRGRRLSLVAASFAAGTLTTAFLVGGQPQPDGAPVVPPVDQFAVEHAGTSGDVPLTDPAVAAVTAGTLSQPFGATGVPGGLATLPVRSPSVSPLVVPAPR